MDDVLFSILSVLDSSSLTTRGCTIRATIDDGVLSQGVVVGRRDEGCERVDRVERIRRVEVVNLINPEQTDAASFIPKEDCSE